jgi:hypothetical protein
LKSTAVLGDQSLGASYESFNGWKGLLSFIGLGMKSSRRFHFALYTELAKYRHVPCNLRHRELELNAADCEMILVGSRCRLQSKEGFIERQCTVSENFDVV